MVSARKGRRFEAAARRVDSHELGGVRLGSSLTLRRRAKTFSEVMFLPLDD